MPLKTSSPIWRKSRLVARLLIKAGQGKTLSEAQLSVASILAQDTEVTDRLIDQAKHSLKGSYAKRNSSL